MNILDGDIDSTISVKGNKVSITEINVQNTQACGAFHFLVVLPSMYRHIQVLGPVANPLYIMKDIYIRSSHVLQPTMRISFKLL
jgi:hypothetical protein